MTDRPDFAALIGSRICHDLIGPIGAIGNGVELLQMGPAGKSPEVALIADSVANASARIRFFRLAFGSGAGETQVARGEVETILADLSRGGRVAMTLTGPAVLARREVKLAFLAAQCLESALPFGGQVAMDRAEKGWALTGRSPRLKVDPALWDLLASPNPGANISPGHIHFALLGAEAQVQGRRLAVDLGATEIRIAF
jgi:histidine phosphotransferase ChpT